MCYCENNETLLGGAIAVAENKIPQLESGIKEDIADNLDADNLDADNFRARLLPCCR